MAKSTEYKVRPSSRNDVKDVLKIFLSPANFLVIKVGDICNIRNSHGVVGPAVAWTAIEKIKDDVIQTSKGLQRMYGLRLDSKVSILPSDQSIGDAWNIELREITLDDLDYRLPNLDEDHSLGWAWLLKLGLQKMDYLTPGLILDNVNAFGELKSFQISRINSSDSRVLYCAKSNFAVHVVDANPEADLCYGITASDEGLGGLTSQFEKINAELKVYSKSPNSGLRTHNFHRPYESCMILHGVHGVGKSHILRKIAEAGWRKVFLVDGKVLDQDNGKVTITKIFSDAWHFQPSVIILDHLDMIAGKSNAQDPGQSVNFGRLLTQLLGGVQDHRTLVVGACRRLSDLDHGLREAGYFQSEIEIPVPDSKSRAEILKTFSEIPRNETHMLLDSIAVRTHGFVGKDLKVLVRQAMQKYYSRIQDAIDREEGIHSITEMEPADQIDKMCHDFEYALSKVHPTAMQEIFVEIPNVRWDDIGGQREVKQMLEEALVWPIKYFEIIKKHMINPKRGLLLYGPPGCSKTMTAKAAAKESGLNFIAVKGSELLSMYVGESERALREVFAKGRAVKPSIIFFDEVDAIGAISAGGQHSGVQTVSTLLNELDGFEADSMRDVFVLAATNKPEVLEPALLRAGRLDTTIYVGLPEIEARYDILTKQMTTMQLGSDVDTKALSENTEGFSGAEMVQLCENARNAAARDEIATMQEQKVSQIHFDNALARTQKSVTSQMIQRYEAWAAERLLRS